MNCRTDMFRGKNKLYVDFGMREQSFDQRGIFIQIEGQFTFRTMGNHASPNLIHVLGMNLLSVAIDEVKGNICITACIVADRVWNITAFFQTEVSEIHDGSRIFFFHGSCCIHQNFNQIRRSIHNSSLVLNGKLSEQKAGCWQGLSINQIAIPCVTNGK